MKRRVTRALRLLLDALPGPAPRRLDRRLRPTAMRRAQLASFLEASGAHVHHVDRHERALRRRRIARTLLVWGTAFAAAWVVLESARAVAMF